MAKKKELSREEALYEAHDRFLSQGYRRSENVSEPTYFFQPGDKVLVGNLKDVVIVNSFDDGKYYQIDYTGFDNNYGRPILTPHAFGFWIWTEIRPFATNKDSFVENSDIHLSYYQTDINSLLGSSYSYGIDMNPSYQRDHVWDDNDREKLLDSIFMNISIGSFVVVDRPFDENMKLSEILDGKQRLKTILDFYENRFSWRGMFFNDLSFADRRWFKYYGISMAKMSERTTEEEKIKVFWMINSNGRIMDKEHLDKIKARLDGMEIE